MRAFFLACALGLVVWAASRAFHARAFVKARAVVKRRNKFRAKAAKSSLFAPPKQIVMDSIPEEDDEEVLSSQFIELGVGSEGEDSQMA